MNKHQAGFSLVELMVALAVALILMAGVSQLFIANKTSYNFNEEFSRAQESGRFGVNFLAKTIRMAGYTSLCAADTFTNVLNEASFTDLASTPIEGAEIQSDTALSWAPDAIVGTHAIRVQFIEADQTVYSLSEDRSPGSAELKLAEASSSIVSGDILLVCDHTHAAVLQATNANSSTKTITHNTGTGTPGNSDKCLGVVDSSHPSSCDSHDTYGFPTGSLVSEVSLFELSFYIKESSGGGRSLYRRKVTYDSDGNLSPSDNELVTGIENLHFVYGIDLDLSDDNHEPTRFVDDDYLNGTTSNTACTLADGTTGQACDWEHVVAVRMTLIATSSDNILNYTESRKCTNTGSTNTVGFTSNGDCIATPTGEYGKLRFMFPATITLRNRMI